MKTSLISAETKKKASSRQRSNSQGSCGRGEGGEKQTDRRVGKKKAQRGVARPRAHNRGTNSKKKKTKLESSNIKRKTAARGLQRRRTPMWLLCGEKKKGETEKRGFPAKAGEGPQNDTLEMGRGKTKLTRHGTASAVKGGRRTLRPRCTHTRAPNPENSEGQDAKKERS